jgi:tetratricopeptide (TPR) repeat protein
MAGQSLLSIHENRMAGIPDRMFKYLACCVALIAAMGFAGTREHRAQTAKVALQAGVAGCQVELDATVAGTTNGSGNLEIADVDPGDHYVHVHCPGKPEVGYFVSTKVGGEARISAGRDQLSPPATDPTSVAENKTRLQGLVQQAIQLRNQARLEDAVAALRQAMALDPENSDLHREMGITFLLAKEWKRARVEMIEAIRHDRTDADAHNGLGYALEKLGDLDAALKEYKIATQLEPDDPTYRTHYFDALVKIQLREQPTK